MTHADTLAACYDELARREAAEAALVPAPWHADEPSAPHSDEVTAIRADGKRCWPVFDSSDLRDSAANATGIALFRNAAPGDLLLKRKMLDRCKAWLTDPVLGTAPFGPDWCKANGAHDAALLILADVAASLGVG